MKARGALLVSASVCGAGAAPPTVAAKVSWLGAMVSCDTPVTVSVTATPTELAEPVGVTKIVPP